MTFPRRISPNLSAFTLLVFFCALITAQAANKDKQSPAEPPELQAARQAMADGLFDIAAVKLQRLLDTPEGHTKDRARFVGLLVEALVRAGDGMTALQVMKGEEIANKPYWEGVAWLVSGDEERALAALDHYPAKGGLAAYADIARAHALLGEGREAAARKPLKPLRTAADPEISRHTRLFYNELELGSTRSKSVFDRLAREKDEQDATVQFLRARALLELKDPERSSAILKDMLKNGKLTEMEHDAATVMLAETLWRQRSAEGVRQLLAFINGFSAAGADRRDTEQWDEAFGLLERVAAGVKPDDTLLIPALAWAADTAMPERQGYALFFVAQQLHRTGKDNQAIGFLESLIQLQPKHPKASDAVRLAMQIHGAMRDDPRVIELAERWRQDFGGGGESVVDFLVGAIRFTRGEYHEALSLFAKAADLETDLTRRRRALYNASLCAIKAGEQAVLGSLMTQLNQATAAAESSKKGAGNAAESEVDVQLDRALQLASKVDPVAADELTAFIKLNPTHRRWAEAQVALAEFSLLDVPPRTKPAAEALAAAAKAPHEPWLQERIDYVGIWLNEALQDLTAVTRTGLAFIEAWPMSWRLDEVRMKVGEAYYRLENFPNARTQFELLVKNQPDSPYADTALFFAGKAAMSIPTPEGLNAAITTWEELAQREGPLAFAARQHQAIAKRRQGHDDEALKLMDDLLEDKRATAEQRYSIQCDKAQMLSSMGKLDAKRYDEAVSLLRGMLQDKGLPFRWSSRVGVLLADALKAQQHHTEALEACYDVVNAGSNFLSQPANPSEYQWFYRAGFMAVELLMQNQQWEAAAKIAEKLAQSSGDRAKEAAKMATDIRLKHFLWDGKK